MIAAKREKLSGWGQTQLVDCLTYRPEKYRDLEQALRRDETLLARGLGRSYGDAALQPAGTLRTERLDHLIAFDTEQGVVRAQAGVTLADLMDIAIPKGWIPPVIPGTRQVTLAGAFACNVHGKNQFRAGDFAEHALSIRILTADRKSVECSASEHPELFWATAGGMGMTGIIQEITLKLKPIASASLATSSCRVRSIAEMIAAFEHYRDSADYMVGWIDHMAKGDELGRGAFEAARHMPLLEGAARLSDYTPHKPKLCVPFPMPGWLLNRYSMAAYNKLRFRRYSTERRTGIAGFNGFFHPLDNIRHWNRLYGRRGFFQYQCLLPETSGIADQLEELLSAIQRQKLFSFLAVLKYHREGKGYLTFSKRGYSLALDFPNTPRVRALLPQIDRWLADRGGRTYLAKDALLTPELFSAMYGQAGEEWRGLLHEIDPASKFTSLMSKRLQWKTEA